MIEKKRAKRKYCYCRACSYFCKHNSLYGSRFSGSHCSKCNLFWKYDSGLLSKKHAMKLRKSGVWFKRVHYPSSHNSNTHITIDDKKTLCGLPKGMYYSGGFTFDWKEGTSLNICLSCEGTGNKKLYEIILGDSGA